MIGGGEAGQVLDPRPRLTRDVHRLGEGDDPLRRRRQEFRCAELRVAPLARARRARVGEVEAREVDVGRVHLVGEDAVTPRVEHVDHVAAVVLAPDDPSGLDERKLDRGVLDPLRPIR